MKEEIIVACCFCGQSLPFDKGIEITIKIEKATDEVQTVYGHKKCLDKVLHQSVPRGFNLE